MSSTLRPVVGVYDTKGALVSTSTFPDVFCAPIRTDIVQQVHKLMRMNSRQPYAVSRRAGGQHSAESWGPGRAVARVPRVSGSGTHRAGQGAFANSCRKGRMFNPTRIWRKWHHRITRNERRFAVASSLAASAIPSLVMARGHRIGSVPEMPLVVTDSIQSITKTKAAIEMLKSLNVYPDIDKVISTKKIRAGIGKMRNRRYVVRKGPLVVYEKDDGLVKAFGSIPGVELVHVDAMNAVMLAPGGIVGRFIVWTQSAFARLDALFGTYSAESALKKNYNLPMPMLTNGDIGRIINSNEVQSVLRPKRAKYTPKRSAKVNPLENHELMLELNPYADAMVEDEAEETAGKMHPMIQAALLAGQ